eukprot:m.151376 g.151376  ORF g.151376 m.151376 type:complete len:1125 (-) comp15038_c0_seq10:131-3505(-)
MENRLPPVGKWNVAVFLPPRFDLNIDKVLVGGTSHTQPQLQPIYWSYANLVDPTAHHGLQPRSNAKETQETEKQYTPKSQLANPNDKETREPLLSPILKKTQETQHTLQQDQSITKFHNASQHTDGQQRQELESGSQKEEQQDRELNRGQAPTRQHLLSQEEQYSSSLELHVAEETQQLHADRRSRTELSIGKLQNPCVPHQYDLQQDQEQSQHLQHLEQQLKVKRKMHQQPNDSQESVQINQRLVEDQQLSSSLDLHIEEETHPIPEKHKRLGVTDSNLLKSFQPQQNNELPRVDKSDEKKLPRVEADEEKLLPIQKIQSHHLPQQHGQMQTEQQYSSSLDLHVEEETQRVYDKQRGLVYSTSLQKSSQSYQQQQLHEAKQKKLLPSPKTKEQQPKLKTQAQVLEHCQIQTEQQYSSSLELQINEDTQKQQGGRSSGPSLEMDQQPKKKKMKVQECDIRDSNSRNELTKQQSEVHRIEDSVSQENSEEDENSMEREVLMFSQHLASLWQVAKDSEGRNTPVHDSAHDEQRNEDNIEEDSHGSNSVQLLTPQDREDSMRFSEYPSPIPSLEPSALRSQILLASSKSPRIQEETSRNSMLGNTTDNSTTPDSKKSGNQHAVSKSSQMHISLECFENWKPSARGIVSLGSLRTNSHKVNVLGVVLQTEPARIITTKNKVSTWVGSVLLGDPTRPYFKLSFWGKANSEVVKRLQIGGIMCASGVRVSQHHQVLCGNLSEGYAAVSYFHAGASLSQLPPEVQYLRKDLQSLWEWAQSKHSWMYNGSHGRSCVAFRRTTDLAEDRIVHFDGRIMNRSCLGKKKSYTMIQVADSPSDSISVYLWERHAATGRNMEPGAFWRFCNMLVRRCTKTHLSQLHTTAETTLTKLDLEDPDPSLQHLKDAFRRTPYTMSTVASMLQVSKSQIFRGYFRVVDLCIGSIQITMEGGMTLRDKISQNRIHEASVLNDLSFPVCPHCQDRLALGQDGLPVACVRESCASIMGAQAVVSCMGIPAMVITVVDETQKSEEFLKLNICVGDFHEQKGSDAAAKFICRGLDMLGAANSDTSFHYFGVNKKKNAEMIVEFFKHIAGKDGPIFELLVNCTIEQDDNGFVVRRRFHLDNIEGIKKSS